MNKATLGLAITFLALSWNPVQAADSKVLYAAAVQYRNAISAFDDVLSDSRFIRRADRNLVGRLEDAAKRMASAAKNPRHINKVRFERKRVIQFQLDAEKNIFDKYSPNLAVVKSWEYVLWTQQLFEQELAFFVEDPRRGRSTTRRVQTTQPSRFLTLPEGFQPTPVRPFDPVVGP